MKQHRAVTQANHDWISALTGSVWFQMFAALCSAATAAASAVSQPGGDAALWEVGGAAAGGAIGGFLGAILLMYVVAFFRAPYRQRNQVRARLDASRKSIRKLKDRRPNLSLGAPYSLAKEWLQTTEMAGRDGIYDTVEARMFRIPVRNEGYFCKNATVRVVRVEPPFPDAPGLSPVIHLHPPLSAHSRYFSLAKRDDAYVDFIGYAEFAGGSWWLASAAARDGFIYYEDDLKPDPVRRVTIEVLGDGRTDRRDYAVFVNMAEALDVTTWEDFEESTAAWERELVESGLTQHEYVEKLFADRDAADEAAKHAGRTDPDTEVPLL